MTRYKIRDEGSYEIVEADSMAEAEEAAREWLRGESWDRSQTIWLDARVIEMDEDDQPSDNTSLVTVTLQPEEPSCIDDDGHDWASPYQILGGIEENPGVWGHGGGVYIQAVCLRCGCGRTRDTWAQRSDTGEQGLESISYEPGKYDLRESADA